MVSDLHLHLTNHWRPSDIIHHSKLITEAQPKAGTGHKMQSISVVFSTLHCEGYIADLRYRWLITKGVLAGTFKFYPPFWKALGMEDSQQKEYSFLGFPSLDDAQVYERKFKTEYLERQFYERLLKSEPSIEKLIENKNTGGPYKRRVCLFVWNIKKCMEEYWRVLTS